MIGSDHNLVDTDGDGLSDSDEWDNYFTDPTNADTDGDGLPDGQEVMVAKLIRSILIPTTMDY